VRDTLDERILEIEVHHPTVGQRLSRPEVQIYCVPGTLSVHGADKSPAVSLLVRPAEAGGAVSRLFEGASWRLRCTFLLSDAQTLGHGIPLRMACPRKLACITSLVPSGKRIPDVSSSLSVRLSSLVLVLSCSLRLLSCWAVLRSCRETFSMWVI
jgi:hypothetical protein